MRWRFTTSQPRVHLRPGGAFDEGAALLELKKSLGHGQWLLWLRSVGLNPRTAQRRIEEYQKRTSSRGPKRRDARLDALREELAELKRMVATLEAELDKERSETERLEERLAIRDESASPEENARIDAIEKREQMIATLKSQLNEWMYKCNEMMRSRNYWRKKAREGGL